MKRPPSKLTVIVGVLFLALLVWAAGPPPGTFIVPSFFTTNAAKIYGTNGVGVSSNTTLGIYVIDGQALTNGLSSGGPTNIFNPNQFTQIGVGGTNVNFSKGALVTNLVVWQTNDNEIALTVKSSTNTIEVKQQFMVNGTNAGVLEASQYGELYVDSDLFPGNLFLGYYKTNTVIMGRNASTGAGDFNFDHNLKDIYPGDTGGYTIGFNTFFDDYYTASGGLQVQMDTKQQKFSIASNNVVIASSGSVTQFDFYRFTSTTQANGKISIGAPDISTGSSNSYTFDATQFARTGTGGTNITLKSGFQGTNAALFGLNTNNGSMDQGGAHTNYGTVAELALTANTVMSVNANKVETSIPNPAFGGGQPLIFNGTNAVFQPVDDGWLLDDEFNGFISASVPVPWTSLLAGVGNQFIKLSSTNWGEMVFTNGFTAADRAGIVNPNATATYVLTNTELWCYVRLAVGMVNTSTISNHLAFGFGDTFSGSTSNGIWIQESPRSTVWQACVANAGAVTTNSLTINVTKDEWREFIWHLDQTQTSVYFYSGNRAQNSTIWCTNTIALPTAACNFFFSSRRMATQTSGSATNSIDHFKVWKRNLL